MLPAWCSHKRIPSPLPVTSIEHASIDPKVSKLDYTRIINKNITCLQNDTLSQILQQQSFYPLFIYLGNSILLQFHEPYFTYWYLVHLHVLSCREKIKYLDDIGNLFDCPPN
jgi:hypothetical protein